LTVHAARSPGKQAEAMTVVAKEMVETGATAEMEATDDAG
jgi:hypothetical protein